MPEFPMETVTIAQSLSSNTRFRKLDDVAKAVALLNSGNRA